MSSPSPSERYAEFRKAQATPAFTEFAALYDFPLDVKDEEILARVGRGVLELSKRELDGEVDYLLSVRFNPGWHPG